MGRKAGTKSVVSVPTSGELRVPLTKLRGMAYLIELCGNLPTTPFDERNCFYGIGLVMTDIHNEILKFANTIERWELNQAKGTKQSDNQVKASDDED